MPYDWLDRALHARAAEPVVVRVTAGPVRMGEWCFDCNRSSRVTVEVFVDGRLCGALDRCLECEPFEDHE